MTHEDERRTLTSIPYKNGEIKIIVAKQDCILGNHYHKIKTEVFQLIQGYGKITDGGGIKRTMNLAERYIINQNESHSFELKKGSILFCICSHTYDKTDDYGY